MAITFVNAGTRGAGTGSVSPGLPSGWAADDLHILVCETGLGEAVPAIAGWSDATGTPVDQGTNTRLTVRWRKAVAGDAAPATGDPGNHIICQIIGFRGVDTTTAWDATATGDSVSSSTTAVTIPGTSSVTDGAMVVACCSIQDDLALSEAGGAFSGWTNANLASITEAIDITTELGNDGGVGAAYGIKTTAGDYGATTATLTANAQQARWSGALKPAGAGGAVTVKRLAAQGVG